MNHPRAPHSLFASLRDELGLRAETPAVVYEPVVQLFFDAGEADLPTIRAVARDAGAAGWLQHGVSLGGLVTRFDSLRRRGAYTAGLRAAWPSAARPSSPGP